MQKMWKKTKKNKKMQINANKCTKSNETTFVTNESWTSETNNQNSSHYMGKLMQSNMLDQVAFQCCDWKNNNISRPVDIQKTWYNLKINLSLSPVMSVVCHLSCHRSVLCHHPSARFDDNLASQDRWTTMCLGLSWLTLDDDYDSNKHLNGILEGMSRQKCSRGPVD